MTTIYSMHTQQVSGGQKLSIVKSMTCVNGLHNSYYAPCHKSTMGRGGASPVPRWVGWGVYIYPLLGAGVEIG